MKLTTIFLDSQTWPKYLTGHHIQVTKVNIASLLGWYETKIIFLDSQTWPKYLNWSSYPSYKVMRENINELSFSLFSTSAYHGYMNTTVQDWGHWNVIQLMLSLLAHSEKVHQFYLASAHLWILWHKSNFANSPVLWH